MFCYYTSGFQSLSIIKSGDAGREFSGGSVIKNPRASEGDADSIPDLGSSYMPQSHLSQTTEPVF